jgi:predicted ATPase/DNA-binding CsgD family transcriptional regulator
MHNLPSQLTLFVGRVEEISEIHALLANPECRLLTVVGVGGIGKTRLALQAAGQIADAFADGVYFVPLQPVTSMQFFVSAVADAIGFTPAGSEEPQAQLLKHVRNKELLLIVDNIEHLQEGVNLLTAILAAAPAVKMLVTSREVLHLQEEWVYPIQGLDYPRLSAASIAVEGGTEESAEDKIDLMAYSAVQLFVERARRMRRGFSLEVEAADVVAICQLTEGMPLALELAASWTRSLSCRAIAGEIRHNLDFLAADWRNIPDRQRSMRAVFDHSRDLLTATEQEVFKRMAVFRGGFHRRAAEFVAGASLATLGSLVNHCLLRWELAGRYQMHELLRQYAEELLRDIPQEKAEIDERHCTYYSELLYKRLPNLVGSGQLEAVRVLEDELENIRVAWQYAVETRNIEAIGKAVQSFAFFFEYRSRHLEGIKLLEEAIEKLDIWESTDPDVMLLAIRFQEVAWFYIRFGRFEEADAIRRRIQDCYDQLGIPPIEGSGTDPLLIASILATIRGDYEAAVRYGEEALEKSHTHPHLPNRQYTYYALASANLAQGNYQDAKQHAEAAHATTQITQDRWFMAYCLIEMGNVASALHDYHAARKHLEDSYAIRKEFNDAEGMAVALNYLGEVALHQEQFAEAQSYFERSVALYRDINDRGGLARALDGLGEALCARCDYAAARHHLGRALEIGTEIQFVSLMCTILTSIANLLVQTGNVASGMAMLSQVSHHPSSTTPCKARARQLLVVAREKVDDALYEIVTSQEPIESVNTLVEMAQVELSVPELTSHLLELAPPAHPSDAGSRTASRTAAEGQTLVEPLTARELEVLNLIVDGLSNQEIASTLFITRGTVKWYTSQIYSKLGIDSRTQAIGRARELSLIS